MNRLTALAAIEALRASTLPASVTITRPRPEGATEDTPQPTQVLPAGAAILDPEAVRILLAMLDESAEVRTELKMTLRTPIEVGNVTYESITLTEPDGEQLAAIEDLKGDLDQLTKLIELNAKIPGVVARKIKSRDLQEARDFFDSFAPIEFG